MSNGASPAEAIPFEDILDGYFTLRESIRQMAGRQGFGWVWLTLVQAPVMDLPGLGAGEPVPLHLREGHAGLIDTLMLAAIRGEDGAMTLHGEGEWRWFDGRADPGLPADIRLGEPAFVRGVGLRVQMGAEAASVMAGWLPEARRGERWLPFSA